MVSRVAFLGGHEARAATDECMQNAEIMLQPRGRACKLDRCSECVIGWACGCDGAHYCTWDVCDVHCRVATDNGAGRDDTRGWLMW